MRKPGKKVGSCHYVHKSAVKETKIPPKLLDFAKNCIPSNFEFHIIKWDSRTNRITLIQSPDWNKAHEPLVGDRWLVDLKKPWNECCKFSKINPNNPQIYHHKWMFVKDNYKGFDVEESRRRSEAWEKLKPNKSKIGYKKYWEENVVPMIKEK